MRAGGLFNATRGRNTTARLQGLPPGERFPRFETSGLFRYIGDTSAISESLQGFPAGSPVMTGLVATKKYLFWRISRHEFETFE